MGSSVQYANKVVSTSVLETRLSKLKWSPIVFVTGRTVTLEQSQRDPSSPSTTGPAVATHIMTCHAGVIYLHILAHPRPNAPLEDGGMPSVTECPGGKLLDYRVTVRTFA